MNFIYANMKHILNRCLLISLSQIGTEISNINDVIKLTDLLPNGVTNIAINHESCAL